MCINRLSAFWRAVVILDNEMWTAYLIASEKTFAVVTELTGINKIRTHTKLYSRYC